MQRNSLTPACWLDVKAPATRCLMFLSPTPTAPFHPQEAPRACKASLRALHERAGPRCLSSCSGDYRLLMASPDQGLSLLAGAVESEEAGFDEPMAYGLGRASPAGRPASRTSPAPSASWHPVHCASPEPADLFSY